MKILQAAGVVLIGTLLFWYGQSLVNQGERMNQDGNELIQAVQRWDYHV